MDKEASTLALRIAAFLSVRKAAAGSSRLVELFLKAGICPEEIATRMLAPALTQAGLRYEPAVGWLPPEADHPALAQLAGLPSSRAARSARASRWELLPGEITERQLASLPDGPGIYRFYDAAGMLLYVGKAKNLKRRVRSYFAPARLGMLQSTATADAEIHGARFLPRVHRLEFTAVGSELEALLKEARVIKRRAPRGNVQLEVHERGRRYGAARAFALLLPRADGASVSAILVRDGRYLGAVAIGPRGGGLGVAGKLIGRAVCRRLAMDRVRSGRATGQSASADRDTEVLNSWLARHGETVSRLELDSFSKAADATAALRRAVSQLLSEPGPVVFR